MSYRIDLKHSILDSETYRYCEIYKITNLVNQKVYIGQAVSHILNHKKVSSIWYGRQISLSCE